MRVYTLVCVLAFCACKPHPGASLQTEQAHTAIVEMNQALQSAKDLHANGSMHAAQDQWSHARATYNQKLRDGFAYHGSANQALRVSYLLGRIANELSGPKGDPQSTMNDLTHELEDALALIPAPQAPPQ